MSRKLSESFSKYSDDVAEFSQPSQPQTCPLEKHIERLELEDKPNEMGKRKMSLKDSFKNTVRY